MDITENSTPRVTGIVRDASRMRVPDYERLAGDQQSGGEDRVLLAGDVVVRSGDRVLLAGDVRGPDLDITRRLNV